MPLAAIGVLLAIGISSLRRGEALIGWGCIAGAIATGVWVVVALLRSRG